MMRRTLRACGVALCASLLAWSGAGGQETRLVTGVIRDSATGAPLSGAIVGLRNASFQRAVRSNQQGEFRIGAVPRGDYRLIARRIGYAELERDVRTMDRDTSLALAMFGTVRELDTMRVTARGMAIYGVVGTAQDVRPLPGVKVQVMGLNRAVTTDSAGRFFVEINKAGRYLVRVARAGYTHQLLSVDVSAERSIETSALLDTLARRERPGTETAWNDFEKRIVWRGPRSAVVAASELASFDGYALSDALNRSATAFRRGMRIGTGTCVFVNGLPRPGFTVDAYTTEQVDAVELYGKGGDGTETLRLAWPSRFPCSGPQGGPYGGGGLPAGTAAYAVIWLKP